MLNNEILPTHRRRKKNQFNDSNNDGHLLSVMNHDMIASWIASLLTLNNKWIRQSSTVDEDNINAMTPRMESKSNDQRRVNKIEREKQTTENHSNVSLRPLLFIYWFLVRFFAACVRVLNCWCSCSRHFGTKNRFFRIKFELIFDFRRPTFRSIRHCQLNYVIRTIQSRFFWL